MIAIMLLIMLENDLLSFYEDNRGIPQISL